MDERCGGERRLKLTQQDACDGVVFVGVFVFVLKERECCCWSRCENEKTRRDGKRSTQSSLRDTLKGAAEGRGARGAGARHCPRGIRLAATAGPRPSEKKKETARAKRTPYVAGRLSPKNAGLTESLWGAALRRDGDGDGRQLGPDGAGGRAPRAVAAGRHEGAYSIA